MRENLLGKRVGIVLVLLIGMAALTALTPTAAAYKANVSIFLDQSLVEVEPGEYTLTGSVSCEFFGVPVQGQKVTVTLEPLVQSTSWTVTPDPAEMEFTDSGSRTYVCIVVVPGDVVAGQYTLEVGGTYVLSPGAPVSYNADAAQSVLEVKQDFRITAAAKPQSLRLSAGETVNGQVEVVNLGNGDDLVAAEVAKGEQELLSAGCGITVDPSELDVAYGTSDNFTISICSSAGSDRDATVTVELILTSTTAGGEGLEPYRVSVTLSVIVGKGSTTPTGDDDDDDYYADDDDSGGGGQTTGDEDEDVTTIYLTDIICTLIVLILIIAIVAGLAIGFRKLRGGSTSYDSSYDSGYSEPLFGPSWGSGHHHHHSYHSGHHSSHRSSSSHRGFGGGGTKIRFKLHR